MKELEILHSIGRLITSLLDLDELLTRIVEASVDITGAEEGYLLLVDKGTGDLYLRAGQNLGEEHAQGFRLKVHDSIAGSVVKTGKPVIAESKEGRSLEIKTGYHVQALLNVPLKVRERVIGVLGVDNKVSDKAFSEDSLRVLSILADYAAIAIENARLFDDAKQRARNLQTLQDLALTFSSSLDLDETLRKACQAAVEFFNADHSGLVLFDPSYVEGKVRAEYPSSGTLGMTIPLRGVAAEGQLIKTREPLGIYDVAGDESLGPVRDILLGFGIQSILIVPMVGKRGDLLGSFSLDAVGHPRQFAAEEVELCKVFAAQAAVAVENAWLFSQLSETKERLDGLIASSFDAVIAIDQDKRITIFNQRAEEMFGWIAEEMLGQRVTRLHVDIEEARRLYDRVSREGKVINCEITLKHKDGTESPALLSAVLMKDANGEETGQAGFIRDLGQTRLYEERCHALLHVSQAITKILELEQVLKLTVDSAVAVFPAAQKGSIHLYDEKTGTLRIKASHGYSPEVVKALTLKVGEGRAGWVYEHATPLVVGNIQEDERSRKVDRKIKHPEVQEQKSAICAPLAVGDRVAGTLSLDNVTTFDAFKPEDVGLLSIFASQAAVAIINAELMTKNSERLRKLKMLSQASNEMMSNLHSLSFDDRLNLIVRHAAQILDAEVCSILLVKRPRFLTKEACYGHVEAGFQKGREFAIMSGRGTGLTGHIAYTGQLFNAHGDDLVGHWAVAGKEPAHLASGKCHSLLAIPLKRRVDSRKQLVGLLEVENKRDKDGQPKSDIGFTKEDEWILGIFADTVVICLENADLYERTSDRLAEKVVSLRAIQETSAAISAKLDLDELLELITQKAAAVFAARAASLMLWDNREGSLVVRAKHGLTDEYTQQRVPREKVDVAIAPMGGLRPLVTVDLRSTPFGRLDLIEAEHLCSVLSVPLAVFDRLIGILNIYSKDEPRQFTADEIEVAEVLASQAAVAIRNAQLYEETERRLRRQAAMLEATQAIATPLDLAQVLRTIADCAREALDFDAVTLYLYDEAQCTFSSPVMSGVFDQASVLQGPVSLDSAVGRMMRYGKPRFADDVTADPIFAGKFIQREKIKSVAGLPLKVEQKTVGVMFFNSRQPRHFTKEAGEALEIFANQAAIAIERGSLFAQTERRATQLRTAAEVARDATSILDMDQLLVTTANLIRERFDFYHIGVFLVDDDGEYVVFRASSGETGSQMLEQGHRLKIGEEGIVGYVARSGEPHIALDVGKDPFHFANPLLPDTRSEMALPLQVRGEMIGVLDVQSVQEAAFTREDVAVLQTLADQLANAIENARLYEQKTQWLSESKTLQQVCVSLTETLELHTVLNRVMQAAIQLTHADEGNILFYDRKRGKFTDALECPGPGQSLQPYRSQVRQRGGHSHTIVQQGQPVVIPDTYLDPSVNPVAIAKGRRAAIGVPLPGREGAIGVLWVNWRVPRHLSKQEVSLLVALASQAAVAIENARQYEELRQTKGLVGTMTAVAWMGTVAGAWRHAIGTYTTTIEDLVKLIRLDLGENLSAKKIEERFVDIKEVISEIRKVPMPPLSMEAGVESVVVNQLIEERISQLRERKGRYAAVTYKSDFALDNAATVRASPEWLRRLLDILVDNAVNAMADTLIKQLTITTQPADSGAEIAVIDTGTGIPRDVLSKLFLEPIKKLKGARGSGLGLFLARTIVQTYGGKLDVGSTGPTGTTMVVWLPVEA